MSKKTSKESFAKFCYEYLPLIIFFVVYKFSSKPNPLIEATIYMIVATLVALTLSFLLVKKIPKTALISASILGFFGALTYFFEDEVFIKIKPTIVNLLFAGILFFGYWKKKAFLSFLLGEQVRMSQKAWLELSKRWGLFFVFLAILNEIIWRNFSTDFWVNFKVFGMMPISLIFTISQLPFMIKEMKKFEEK